MGRNKLRVVSSHVCRKAWREDYCRVCLAKMVRKRVERKVFINCWVKKED